MKKHKFKSTREMNDFILEVGKEAVHKAQEENRKLGIPNNYVLNGKHVYELPNGEITTKSPFK